MDVEKYTSGKLYIFFEWAFKLIIWNLLALTMILLVSALPLFLFFQIQNKYEIKTINVVENIVEVTLNNEDKSLVGNYVDYEGEITNIEIDNNILYFNLNEKEIKINNEERIKNIDKLVFENKELIAYFEENKVYNFGDIYTGEIDFESSSIDSASNVIISFTNGTEINYGVKFDIDSTISGILVLVAVILIVFVFIPAYTTVFSMIKIYADEGSGATFLLFFDRLWDNFKSLYRLELILVPAISLMSYALYTYYYIIQNATDVNFFFSFAYNFILIALIIALLFILNIPFTLGYFRMKTKSLFKFTISMTFRNILYSILYLALIVLPILACFLNNFFIPLWFLLGFSLPLFIEYYITAKKYRYIEKNLDAYKEEDIYDLKEDNQNEIRN